MALPAIPKDRLGRDGRVTIYSAETGEPMVRWPVDAREMLERGLAVIERPADKTPGPEAALASAARRTLRGRGKPDSLGELE